MIINNYDKNVHFQGRCPAVRDSQWVVETLNNRLPHISSTRNQSLFLKYVRNKSKIVPHAKDIDTLEDFRRNTMYKFFGVKPRSESYSWDKMALYFKSLFKTKNAKKISI